MWYVLEVLKQFLWAQVPYDAGLIACYFLWNLSECRSLRHAFKFTFHC